MIELKNKIDEFVNDVLKKDKNLNTLLTELQKLFSNYPKVRAYGYISKSVHKFYANISEKDLVDLQKLHLLTLISNSLNKLDKLEFSDVIVAKYQQFWEKTANSLINDTLPEQFYNYKNNRFLKAQSICSSFTIPAYPFILDNDRLSLKFLKYGGLGQLITGILFIIFKLRGFYPLYKTHTNLVDVEAMKTFNEEGWRKMFINVAELLKHKKNIKGICGTSWFIDPKLKDISPELAYINQIFSEMGTKIFEHNTDKNTIKDALFMNQKRKELYESKKYFPQKYVFIIPRVKLIKWAESHKTPQ